MQRLLVLCAVLGIGLVVGLAVVSGTDHWRSAKPDTNTVPLWACFKLEVWFQEPSQDLPSDAAPNRFNSTQVVFWCPPGDDVRVIQELGNGRRATLHLRDLRVTEEEATARSWGYDLNFDLEASNGRGRCWPKTSTTRPSDQPIRFQKGRKPPANPNFSFDKRALMDRFSLIDVAPVEEVMRPMEGSVGKANRGMRQ